MSKENEREERTAWWGTCINEECLTSMVIYPHADADQDMPEDTDDWRTPLKYIDCPVCDSSMMWGGTDHPADLLKSY